MCGLTGFWHRAGGDAEAMRRQVRRMAEALAHRGPDDAGEWVDGEAGLAFAHRRLSIIELSPLGRQPMASQSGRYVLVYNGEIYDHQDLRRELEAAGVVFRGGSDTETLVEAFAAWGVVETLSRCSGMFALALWDRAERRLWLARDRLGIKPLYWGRGSDDTLLFASELGALAQHPACPTAIDRTALGLYARYGFIPAPHAILAGIHKLRPGTCMAVEADGRTSEHVYWDLQSLARGARREIAPEEAVDRLEALLRRSVRQHLLSDVPVGAFLSGGVDSSTVVALMRDQGPVRTFCIGFESPASEAPHAAAVARHLGTDHVELIVTAGDMREQLPHLADMTDEPFADPSLLPTYLVARLARSQVTVSLSGDGGDELFAGYARYAVTQRLAGLPLWLRRMAAGGAARLPAAFLQAAGPLGAKLRRVADVIGLPDGDAIFESRLALWHSPAAVGADAFPPSLLTDGSLRGDFPELRDRMQLADTLVYLPDDILFKVDRASMAVGLEARVPLLDHRVVEFAWSLPPDLMARGGVAKWPLRQVLHRHVPRGLIDRPKQGFDPPIDAWLRGPLRDWAHDLLSTEDTCFDAAVVRRAWEDHLSGRRNLHHPLWAVIMFRAWRRRFPAIA